MRFISLLVFSFLLVQNLYSQNLITNVDTNKTEIYGSVYDSISGLPLAFSNIGIVSKNRGTVSNENGGYVLNIMGLRMTDTVKIQYVGYKDKELTVEELLSNSTVLLKENIISIKDFIVYSDDVDIEQIVENVLINREKNYKFPTVKSKMFIRDRYATDIDKLKIKPLKNSFDVLDDSTAIMVEQSIPKVQLSYTDYLGYVYIKNNGEKEKDKENVKLKPIKIISLRDKTDFSKINNTFSALFKNAKKNEYWKVASGVFSTKLTVNGDEKKKDSTYNVDDYKNTIGSWFFEEQINRSFDFLSMNDEDLWEFLHNTNKYNYELFGGTKINGEDVYIIDFTPKRRGDYIGRLYISRKSFAIIKAEFEYGEGKNGTDISLFGVAYKETVNRVSVFYVKKGNTYRLKYLFRQEGEAVHVNRKISLLKKRERFLLDKTIAKYKVKLDYIARNLNSVEILVVDESDITTKSFDDFKQKKHLKVKYVNEFDDSIWKGYSIIAPTQQMKDYRKR